MQALAFERKRLVMKRKKYRITIKMIKETTMEHEQENMKLAVEDVKKLMDKSSDENLNKIFNSVPRFIYKIKII